MMKALFFADKPRRVLSSACSTQAHVTALPSFIRCIFFPDLFIHIVAPCACQNHLSLSLACAFCGLSQILIWNIHERMNTFVAEKKPPVHPEGDSFPAVALLWNGVAWFLKAAHMPTPSGASGCASPTMEEKKEKGNDLAPIWGAGAVASKRRA